jgi:hypothetical protein
MVAKITASVPKTELNFVREVPVVRIAPTSVMPEIAFEPDIRGVCSFEGTFEMTSNPTNIASTSMRLRQIRHASWMEQKSMVFSSHHPLK